ncbi:MAG: imidazoleglycerol-phosphate dehydratase HisB [Ruminococcaceae bacterium]|nr:imidazoleglycerol-phosphate dehydratase HisB [Oscillospiraceae bacterium]
MRNSIIERKTNETDIKLSLLLDGSGKAEIDSGIGFLDHMLVLFARHARFDLALSCKGDLEVDGHHTTEDIGIVLGTAFAEALGDKKGIERYSHKIIPMDEALVLCAVDISGRAHLHFNCAFPTEKIGEFDTELVREFFEAFVRAAGVTLHIKKFDGINSHHIAECIFKAFARVLGEAVRIDERFKDEVPSTKGVL